MARQARKRSSTGKYLVTMKARHRLFLDEKDREYFISLLDVYITPAGRGNILKYAFSDKIACIKIAEGTKTISELIKPLCTSYARYFNRKYHVEGSLFDGRFKSLPLECEEDEKTALRLIDEIERNI